MIKKRVLNRETVLFAVIILVIFTLRIVHIGDLNAPIIRDEAGYWGHAANLAGLSWTEVEDLWFSYGYSIILLPLFWITHNMAYLYRIAIVLNALMGVFSFLLGKAIIQELDKNCKNVTAMFISFTATCYSAYIFQSNIAWSETFLYTWFMLTIWSAIKFFKNATWSNTFFVSMVIGVLYIIHNRSIPIIIAYVMVLCYMIRRKQIEWKKLVPVFFVFVVTFGINAIMKDELSVLMWGNISGFSGNDMASQGEHLKLFLGFEGWKILLQSLLGKVWYIFTATLMFAYWGLAFIVKRIMTGIMSQRKNQQCEMFFFYLFLGLCVCGIFAIATIAMVPVPDMIDCSGVIRLDIFFYGRYSEMFSGPLIILGLLQLKKNVTSKHFLQLWLVGLVLYMVVAGSLYYQIHDIGKFFINYPCVPGILFNSFSFMDDCGILLTSYLINMVIILIYIRFTRTDKMKIIQINLVCVLLVIVFSCVAYNGYNFYILMNQEAHKKLDDICEILETYNQYPIFCYSDDEYFKRHMRTRVVEGVIEFERPGVLEENYFLVSKGKQEVETHFNSLYFMAGAEHHYFLACGDQLTKDLQSKGLTVTKLNDLSYETLDYSNIEMAITGEDKYKVLPLGSDLCVNVDISCDKKGIIVNDVPIFLSYHVYDENGNIILWEGSRYEISPFVGSDTVAVKIPADSFEISGKYVVKFDMVEEGVAWLSDSSAETPCIDVLVEKGLTATELNNLSYETLDFSNIEMAIADEDKLKELPIGSDLCVNIDISCAKEGIIINELPIFLSYHIYDENGNIILWDGRRYSINPFVSSETVAVQIPADLFEMPGKYVVEFDVVEEGVAWLSDDGTETLRLDLVVD